MALTASLLDFILSLLGNRAAADDYLNDPEAALESAGLGGMTCQDLDAVRPVVLDVAMVNQEGSFDRDYNTGGNGVSYGDSSNSAGGSPQPRWPPSWRSPSAQPAGISKRCRPPASRCTPSRVAAAAGGWSAAPAPI